MPKSPTRKTRGKPHPERNDALQPIGEANADAANPTTTRSTDSSVKESIVGRPDQDATRLINPGSGGATEHGGRLPHHPGMNPPQNQPNS